MANKTNAFELEVLENWFNNQDIPNLGDASGVRGSATAGSLYIALFTADPTDTGSFANECNGTNYSGYARAAVARTSGAWAISGTTQVTNNSTITFPQSAGTSAVITHAAVCKTLAGITSTDMIIHGQLNNPLTVTSGVTPQFAAGNIIFTEE